MFRFLFYFKQFIEKNQLIDKNKKLLVCVSGGVDSVFLAYSLSKIYPIDTLVYFNHQTRTAEEHEADKKAVEALGLKVATFIRPSDRPFTEASARAFRRDILETQFPHHQYALGHHLDDAFEWHLMKQFSSSKATFMPVKDGPYLRPLLCLSKDQIRALAHQLGLCYTEDATNINTDYERNYIRQLVVPLIKNKYPQYLKHFVYQQNGRSSFAEKLFQFMREKDPGVKSTLSKQLANIEKAKATLSFDRPMKGPFSLGKWHFYLLGKAFLLCPKNYSPDEAFLKRLKGSGDVDFIEMKHFPYLRVSKTKKLKTKWKHPLLPKTFEYIQERGWTFEYKPLNKNKKIADS